MLPRIATPVTVPTPAPQAPATEAAPAPVRQQLSPEALANLRAAVLLRLLEAMMRQLEQGGDQGHAARHLLEVLLEAMKALPPRDGAEGDATRRLALLIARLPAEMRPAAERLLATVLATAPTRILMEIIRNPAGPDAQRLAQALLAAVKAPGGDPAAPAASQARFIPGEAQLVAAATGDRQRQREASGDGRSLQAALRRLFEGGAEPLSDRPARTGPRSASAPALPQQDAAAPIPKRADIGPLPQQRTQEAPPVAGRTTAMPANAEAGNLPANGRDALRPEVPDRGPAIADRSRAAPEAGRSPVTSAALPTAAVGREYEGVLRMIAGIVADLTADEALVLRLLLQAPLPDLPDVSEAPASAAAMSEMTEDGDETAGRLRTETAMPDRSAVAAGTDMRGPSTSEAENAARAAVQPQRALEDETPAGRPPVAAEDSEAPARTSPVPLPPQLPERAALPQFRDGLAVPFVPYLPAQDDLEPEDRRRQPSGDEEETTDTSDENGSDGEKAGGDAGAGDGGQTDDEADTPEMAKRRQKIDDLVGPPDPGFAFYQKLGEYWT